MQKRATLKNIAQKAGVSSAAVSIILNDKPSRISQEKKDEVKRIAEELNYIPNQIAKSLSTSKLITIGLVVPDLANPFFATLSKEIEMLKSAVPMGVVNIVEGVIPIVMNDLLKGVIATAVGGAVGGTTSLVLGADATVPFGGFLMIPTMSSPLAGILAILANALATAVTLVLLKRKVTEEDNLNEQIVEEQELDLDHIEIII